MTLATLCLPSLLQMLRIDATSVSPVAQEYDRMPRYRNAIAAADEEDGLRDSRCASLERLQSRIEQRPTSTLLAIDHS